MLGLWSSRYVVIEKNLGACSSDFPASHNRQKMSPEEREEYMKQKKEEAKKKLREKLKKRWQEANKVSLQCILYLPFGTEKKRIIICQKILIY